MAIFPVELQSLVLSKLLPGAIGALLSCQFVPDGFSKPHRTFWSFISGCAVSYYIGGATIEYFQLTKTQLLPAVYFCFGLFGLTLVMNAMTELKPLVGALLRRRLNLDSTPQQPVGDEK